MGSGEGGINVNIMANQIGNQTFIKNSTVFIPINGQTQRNLLWDMIILRICFKTEWWSSVYRARLFVATSSVMDFWL